jgi:hypothetical protein
MRLLRKMGFLQSQAKKALNFETFSFAKDIPQSY